MVTAVDSFIEDNFFKITASSEFLNYPLENVETLISHDNLRELFGDVSEKDIFKAVIEWIQQDPKSRLSELETLLSKICVSRLSADFIEDTVKPFLNANGRYLSCLSNLENTEENAESDETALIALALDGGYFQLLIFMDEKWITLSEIPEEEFDTSAMNLFSMENYVALYYKYKTSTATLYNFKTGKYNQSKIIIPKYNKLVALEGRVYAVGLNGDDLSAKVFEDGGWKTGASLSIERRGASVVANKGRIYVLGGYQCGVGAEVYDPVKDEWESIPPMSTARFYAGAASLSGKIYVVGGYGADYNSLASCECYDPETNTWTRIPNMIEARSFINAVAKDGALFVNKDNDNDNGMSIYSPKSNSWEDVEVTNSEEGFILALSTLSKKYLPMTLENMNSSAIASSPAPATDSASASKRDADASECEVSSKTAKKSRTMASDGDESASSNPQQDENSNKEGLPEAEDAAFPTPSCNNK